MNGRQTEPAYRAISIITLIQAGTVVGGTLFVSAMCKLKGYGGGIVPDAFFRSDALFVRRSGWMLLFIPVCWAALAIFAARGAPHPWLQQALIGLAVAAILFGIYHYASIGLQPTIL